MVLPLAIPLDDFLFASGQSELCFHPVSPMFPVAIKYIDFEPRGSKKQHRGILTLYQDASPRPTKFSGL
jgi:hypothetical protein